MRRNPWICDVHSKHVRYYCQTQLHFWGAGCRLHLLVASYRLMLYYVSESLWNVQKLTFWGPILTYDIHNPQFHDHLHALTFFSKPPSTIGPSKSIYSPKRHKTMYLKKIYNCKFITRGFQTILVLIECKTKWIFTPTALSKIKPDSAILLVDICSMFVANHSHICSHFAPSNINILKQKNISLDSVSLPDWREI